MFSGAHRGATALQHTAEKCSASLQHTAALHFFTVWCSENFCQAYSRFSREFKVQISQKSDLEGFDVEYTATHCNALQHTATHCSTLQHTATTLALSLLDIKHTATHCNTLQHTATHCNALQHTATHCNTLQRTATHCNALQRTATHCNMLQRPYLYSY